MTYKGVTPTWAWLETEIDFGDTPVPDKSFHIVNADVGPRATTQVMVCPDGDAPTGLTSDEWQADGIAFAASADVDGGGFTIYAHADKLIKGKRRVYYQVT
jgi:hypothetical protein